MIKSEFRAMGSHIIIMVDSPFPQAAVEIQQAPIWFENWEQSFSRFRVDSELNRLNQHQGEPFQVSTDLWEVLQLALRTRQESLGLVTPAVLDMLEFVGYQQSFENIADNKTIRSPIGLTSRLVTLDEVVLEPSTQTVLLPAGVRLDFGGVAKGWSAHQAMLRLAACGPTLVNAGGDIAISDLMQNGEAWHIGITDPVHPDKNLEIMELGGAGVATSGKDYRHWHQEGVMRHHIIDPRTGLPAETDVVCATVVAPSLVEAEMAAKAIFILGSLQGLAWLENHTDYAGYLVLDDGKTICNDEMEKYLCRK